MEVCFKGPGLWIAPASFFGIIPGKGIFFVGQATPPAGFGVSLGLDKVGGVADPTKNYGII
jgi:hypothetical protein